MERVLDLIPRCRTNDVVLFDPADREFPVGMNVIEQVPPDARPLVASGLLAVFRKAFPDAWGPRTEHVMRNAILALLEVRGATLLLLPRMLLEDRARESIVRQVRDPLVRWFWITEFPKYPPAFRAEIVAPVLNKLGAVLTNPLLRNIMGQHRSAFSPREIMDGGQIFLANLAKGRIGEDVSRLLGALLVGRFQSAAYSRAELDPAARRPFTLYVDEFQSFVTPAFAELLAEARKYGLALVVAHQHLGQLDDDLRRAVIGNVGTLVAFRLGAEDADVLGSEFEPEISPYDLTRLARYQIAIRLAVDGMTTAPFTATTLPPYGGGERVGHGEVIRRASRDRYGCPRAHIEPEMARWA